MPAQQEPYKMPWALPEESPNKPATVPLQEAAQDHSSNQPIPPQPNKGGHSTPVVVLASCATFIISVFLLISALTWIPLFLLLIGVVKIDGGGWNNNPILTNAVYMLIVSGPMVASVLVAFFMSRPAKVQSSTSNATIETPKEKPSTLNKKFLISVGIVLILILLLLSTLISF